MLDAKNKGFRSLKNISVSDYANLMGVSPVTVYRWIDKGKVEYITEVVDDREVKRILIDPNVINSNNKVTTHVNNTVNTGNNPVVTDVRTNEITSNKPVDSTNNNTELLQLLNKMYNDYSKITDENRYLAELAGQTKLLTDSERETKQHYFEVVQENKTLFEEKVSLETENRILKEQIDKLQSKLEDLPKKEDSSSWWTKKL